MTELHLKDGVRLHGLRPEMLVGLQVVHSIFDKHGKTCVVTSANDSAHSRGSLHYQGWALDFRTRHLSDQSEKDRLAASVKKALGGDFDVVLESTHLHVEWDPD